ncbi:hypothetical protein B0H17DRAFT_1202303 [Mycena rosella]|uniref:RRM domain-containing protein n=1 Tax=Mycena rosella TaxID=1033263 RepID=A0AAD7GDK8_MYCRO|nr:hypothetical protein B0H17DRAFT_1202303 [Mycena rosella]
MASFRADRVARKPYSRPTSRPSTDGQWLHDLAPGAPGARARFAAAPGALGSPAVPSNRLVVSNLHYEISPKDLTAIFGQIDQGTMTPPPALCIGTPNDASDLARALNLKYDRSGRSSGTATVSFETPAEAARAKKQFDGILAKGQPMAIVFDITAPRGRSSSAPTTTTASLLNRIQKAPLLTRLSKDDTAIRAPSAPCSRQRGPHPHARHWRPRCPRTTRPAPKAKKGPKTAADLDKELDAFMGDTEAAPAAPPAAPAQDVEMA